MLSPRSIAGWRVARVEVSGVRPFSGDHFGLEVISVGTDLSPSANFLCETRALANETEQVILTVYSYEGPESWESVIVTGPIHLLDDVEIYDRFASLFFPQTDDAAGNRRWKNHHDIDREWYEIRITETSGRRIEGLHSRNP